MIITHAQSPSGQRRIYLGGKSSLECWIEPRADGSGWSFHLDRAVTGTQLTSEEERSWAIHTLSRLAEMLNVRADALAAVPFDQIAALHAGDPYAGRRVATPKRRAIDNGFMATPPHITRPSTDFASRDHPSARRPR